MKRTDKRKTVAYSAVFTREGIGYIVEFPALDGCVTQGDSLREAKAKGRDALRGYLKTLRANDDSWPEDHGPRRHNRNHRVVRLRVRLTDMTE